ncbi:MAG: penicillin-binding protein 1C [Odoribacteraceae bacterium]|nr:penicillin-binding protein 1C [Odoribacteraceae bacterium]
MKRPLALAAFLSLLLAWWKFLPAPLFAPPYSTAITDRRGQLIGITVADDGQYRLPGRPPLSDKYIAALLCFEDKRFPYHPGVDLPALARAAWQNIKSKKITSGGSTITMQLVRLSRGNPPRTIPEKILEILLALRLEQSLSKRQIIELYATHAPFGGNIVGIQAAALRYFNRAPDALSWAEAALLAVLPNAPALAFPGKNERLLKEKRDRLLQDMHRDRLVDAENLSLAIAEPLPAKLHLPPRVAPHLLARASIQRRGQISPTYIDSRLQEQVNDIVKRRVEALQHNRVHNIAVLVASVPAGEVLAYVANAPRTRDNGGEQVDLITAPRGSGSILKPALYALAQREGRLLPGAIIPDVPSRFGDYQPLNFNKEYRGVVPADNALASSLNIPFVRILQEYGVEHFHHNLRRLGISTLHRPPEHYGLSLILGGAECTLWDVANLYAGMASSLLHYRQQDGALANDEFSRLCLWGDERPDSLFSTAIDHPIDAPAAWLTLQALMEVERPDVETGWKHFASSAKLAWKTGTSFGFRDAWAVGVNAEHVIGVWVGNADGEGRPGLVGTRAAAPVLFEVAALLPPAPPLPRPSDEMIPLTVCRQSGYRASAICPEADTVWTCRAGEHTPACPYHRLVHLDSAGFRVNSDCEPVHRVKTLPWFVLSPVQEWYYARSRPSYKRLPPYRPGCVPAREEVMELIYPRRGVRVFIPRDLGGVSRGVVFEMIHRDPSATVHWHVDSRYLGHTRHHHQLEVTLSPGPHVLHLVDASGNTLEQYFSVVAPSR